jgi:hypothetical protein
MAVAAELAAGRQAPPRLRDQCHAGGYPEWFREDLERLFEPSARGAIRPRAIERISFDVVAGAHRRREAGGLEGKLVLCPNDRHGATGRRVSVRRTAPGAEHGTPAHHRIEKGSGDVLSGASPV